MAPPNDERDAARRAIAARRERFMRAALAGAGIAAATGCDPSGPVCHAVRRNVPSVAKGVGCHFPGPCLSVEHVPVDAGAPANADAGPSAADAGDADTD